MPKSSWFNPHVRSGELREIVSIQQPAPAQDAYGQAYNESWTDFADNLPAAIEPMTGGEQVTGGQIYGSIKTFITMRYLPGVNPAMRVVWTDSNQQEHFYDIESIRNVKERNRKLVLVCIERVEVGGSTASEA